MQKQRGYNGKTHWNGSLHTTLSVVFFLLILVPIDAQAAPLDFSAINAVGLLVAAIGAGIVLTILLLIYRNRANTPVKRASAEADFIQQRDHYERLLAYTGQCVVSWESPFARPQIAGRMHALEELGILPADILRFGQWLEENELRVLDQALEALRQEAQPFELYLKNRKGTLLQVSGLIAGASAIARFQDISASERVAAQRQHDMVEMQQRLQMQTALLEALDEPVWINSADGNFTFTNKAFRDAVGYSNSSDLPFDASLFNEATRLKIAESKPVFKGMAHAIVHGERRIFEVTQISGDQGAAATAHDISAAENLNDEMKRIIRGHSETLDQISTAVAIFGADQKLKFANQSFAMLWPLDTLFLESEPSHTLLLDRLREGGIIAEQPDWRGWKDDLFSAYRSGEPSQHIWNLPDGRTLRVLASPHPQGGVTWLFENLTEKIDLERRYNTLIKMQGETLDHLSEGVAVFGADGRVQLSNPALAKLWSLPQGLMVEGTHITRLQAHCAPMISGQEWNRFAAFITGFAETRDAVSGRMDLRSNVVLDYALVPLPNGQTMMTFVNVTDTVNVTRALQEKNEALESADRLRSEFVQHVSYELRTPLTNIIGFSDMLRTETFGPLNQRQHEYLDHIGSESGALLNIVNDILDLATLDAGIMELDIKEVDIADAMAYATERTEERLGGRPVTIVETIDPALGHIAADAARLRQIFVNLLSNAANFAPDNSSILFSAEKDHDDVVFTVHDDGCGIPEDILDTVFKRFSSHSHHGARAGAGLGLSIVKSFVELHGGSVTIETGQGKGTTILCRFPSMQKAIERSDIQ